ncbi:MAG TPA: cytochrome c [Longimicrobiales bacterium]|nr:cytochrome c [Longimicrobiales bacterium]
MIGRAAPSGSGPGPLARARLALRAAYLAAALAACEEHEFHPPDRDAQVAEADALYRPAAFDTIQWPDSAARFTAGNELYASTCRKCHGPTGEAGTEYAAAQGIDVPSLVRDDFPYDSIDDVRRRVFAGHPEGMPTFGVGKLSLREIDAVAAYLLEGLRSE